MDHRVFDYNDLMEANGGSCVLYNFEREMPLHDIPDSADPKEVVQQPVINADTAPSEDIKRDWSCPFPSCASSYVSKQSLNKHWAKKHPDQEIPQEFRVKKRQGSVLMTAAKRKKPSLRQMLGVFEKSQLVDVICNIAKLPGAPPVLPSIEIELQRSHDNFCDFIFSLLPEPDLAPTERELDFILNQITRAFPPTNFGSNRDNFAFKRVSPHLAHFKTVLLGHLKTISSSQNWSAVLEFVTVASRKICNLPVWDDPINNKIRDDLWSSILRVYKELLYMVDTISDEQWTLASEELCKYPEMESTVRELLNARSTPADREYCI